MSRYSGSEHYQIAEVLLANLRDEMAGSPGTPLRTPEQQAQMIAEAHVHATLALTAATLHAAWVNNDALSNAEAGDYERWARATTGGKS